MAAVRTHKDLIVWRKSVLLASRVHELTATFVGQDRLTLGLQMRRCAISIASNIAEGAGRSHRPEYIRFLNIARGSLAELETQVLICAELKLVRDVAQIEAQVAEVGRLLTGLIRRLREHRDRASGFAGPSGPFPSH